MWELKGKYERSGYEDGRYYVTFAVEDLGDKPQLGDTLLKIKVDKYHPPKSRNANGYYWELCKQLARELSKEGTYTTMARVHNLHLRSMWQELLIYRDGVPKFEILPNTDRAEQECLEDPDYHLMPSPAALTPNPIFVNSKGKEFRYYVALRGVRTMDSKTMSHLINICVQNCKDQGIKTLDDIEMERLEGYEKDR